MSTVPGVAVLAKAPVAGLAKTRLAPALGAEGAAALAARLLHHAVTQALAAGLGPVTLWVAPDASHPAFQRWQGRPGLSLAQQPGGDLGARMALAFAQARGPLLLMGTDAPALDAQMLREAAAALRGRDAVFVPAVDGGYALVGLQRPAPTLFSAMPWSTPQVMAQTRARLAQAGLRHAELRTVADIDEPADLVHLPPGWAAPG
jgi:uncharacterized protein